MTTQIRVLGPGCARCQKLYENTTEAVAQMGLDAHVDFQIKREALPTAAKSRWV